MWGLLTALMVGRRDAGFAVAESYGLTMGDMKALLSLTDGEAPTMSSLAEAWGCDASNVTWLVDRLEQGGCVVRQPSTTDRRAKTVVLTARGRPPVIVCTTPSRRPRPRVRPQPRGSHHLGPLLRKAGFEPCEFHDMVHSMGQKPRTTLSPG